MGNRFTDYKSFFKGNGKMTKKQILIIALIIPSTALVAGCMLAAVGVGAVGTVAYIRGDLEVMEAVSLDKVYNAAVKAVAELELRETGKTKDVLTATITARDAENKKVNIKLSAQEAQITKISIRIGTFGNETKSRRIYEQIKKNLQ
jgi:hypothetical protein